MTEPTKSPDTAPANEASRLREVANSLPPGPLRDATLKRAQQEETSHMNAWRSSDSQTPKK